jgi:hypothetical protein
MTTSGSSGIGSWLHAKVLSFWIELPATVHLSVKMLQQKNLRNVKKTMENP